MTHKTLEHYVCWRKQLYRDRIRHWVKEPRSVGNAAAWWSKGNFRSNRYILWGEKRKNIIFRQVQILQIWHLYYAFMTDTFSAYKFGLAEEKLLVLLISAVLQLNLANGSCCNKRAFVLAIGFYIHRDTRHKHRKGGLGRGRWGWRQNTRCAACSKCSH